MPAQPLTRLLQAHKDIEGEYKVIQQRYQTFLSHHQAEVEECEKTVRERSEENNKLITRCSEVREGVQHMEQQVARLEAGLREVRAEEEMKRSGVSKLKTEMSSSSREREFPAMKECILLYKKVSGIKWDYNEPGVVSGYIIDKRYGNMKPFTYNTRENSHSYIINSLWKSVNEYSKPFILDDE